MKGIDISHYQVGRVDYGALRASGIEFAILKVSEGGNPDAAFVTHYNGLRAAGIPVGAYVYCRATSVRAAIAEAEMALAVLDGRALQLPIFYDIEEQALELGGELLLAMAKAFASTVSAAGYRFGVYSNQLGFWYLCPLERLRAAVPDAAVWVARYGAASAGVDGAQIWQHTNTGRIPGIGGDVDLDLLYDKSLIQTASPVPESGTAGRPAAPESAADLVTAAVVGMLQLCMAVNGYWPWDQLTGEKSPAFRAAIVEYAADVART